jgi:uncharacterized protein YkwD
MARYTLDTTSHQEAALSSIVAKRNAERAAQALPALTNAEYVTSLWQSMLQSYIDETERDEDSKLREAYRDPSKRAAIKAAAKI